MKIISSLTDFLLPRYCKVCGRRLTLSEMHLCISCFIGLPVVKYENDSLSKTETLLLSERNLVRASSMIQYDKESDYRRILLHLKYWGHPDVGCWMASIGARLLYETDFFSDVDCIVPLPLTRGRLRQRGYNQCLYIAQGIRSVTNLPIVDNAILRHEDRRGHQAGLGLFQRWSNVQGLFHVIDTEALRGRHLLLIDDVITTGSTLCSLIETLNQSVQDIRISVFTLAITV